MAATSGPASMRTTRLEAVPDGRTVGLFFGGQADCSEEGFQVGEGAPGFLAFAPKHVSVWPGPDRDCFPAIGGRPGDAKISLKRG